ncbi:Zinc finger protein [Armadillidium vulgare]|nr:Zinc finger protein [Armadillidium vulgare]
MEGNSKVSVTPLTTNLATKRFRSQTVSKCPDSDAVNILENVEKDLDDESTDSSQHSDSSDNDRLEIGESLIITKVSSSPTKKIKNSEENIVSFQKICFDCNIIKKHSNACGCLTPRLHVYILSKHQCDSSCKTNNSLQKIEIKDHKATVDTETDFLKQEETEEQSISERGSTTRELETSEEIDQLPANSSGPSNEKVPITKTCATKEKGSFLGVKRILKRRKLKVRKTVGDIKSCSVRNINYNNTTKNVFCSKDRIIHKSKTKNLKNIRKSHNNVNGDPGVNNTNGDLEENEDSSKIAPKFNRKGKALFQINKTGAFFPFHQNFIKINVSSLLNSSSRSEEKSIEIKEEIDEPIEDQEKSLDSKPSFELGETKMPLLTTTKKEDESIDIKIEPDLKIKTEDVDEDYLNDLSICEDGIVDGSTKLEDDLTSQNQSAKTQLGFSADNFPPIEDFHCNLCTIVFPDLSSLMIHLQNHQKDGLLICFYCQKCFGDKTTLKRHMRTHTGEKPYQCKICKKRFSLPGNFKKHRDIHEDIRTEPCDICGKMFRRKEHLKQHKLTHTGEKPYKCSLCNSCFTARYSLKIHMNIHLGRKPFKCSYCGKSFSDKSTMTKHIRIHTGERPFSCKICQKRFGESGALASHTITHSQERPFPCTECSLSFKSNRGLRQHLKTHFADKRYSCRYCGTMFIQKYNMIMHERIHTGEKPYRCPECNRTFRSRSCLGKHVVLHRGENNKKYACDFCEKKFHRKAHLKRHISTHLGVKDHECEICLKKFSIEASLKKHVINFHSEGARAFPCRVCGKVFKRSIYVVTHKCLSSPVVKEESAC